MSGGRNVNVGKVVKLPNFLCTTLDSLCRHPELTTHCSQLKMATADGKEDNPELVSRTNRFKLVTAILVRYRREPKTALGSIGEGFKWYFVVPEGFSEGVFGSVRKPLEMPFFASERYKKRPALSSRSYDFYGTPRGGRTLNLLVRSQTLYPIELWVRNSHII